MKYLAICAVILLVAAFHADMEAKTPFGGRDYTVQVTPATYTTTPGQCDVIGPPGPREITLEVWVKDLGGWDHLTDLVVPTGQTTHITIPNRGARPQVMVRHKWFVEGLRPGELRPDGRPPCEAYLTGMWQTAPDNGGQKWTSDR